MSEKKEKGPDAVINVTGLQGCPSKVAFEITDRQYAASAKMGGMEITLAFDDAAGYEAKLPEDLVAAMKAAKTFVVTLSDGTPVECLLLEHAGHTFLLAGAAAIRVTVAEEDEDPVIYLKDEAWDILFPEEDEGEEEEVDEGDGCGCCS